MSEYVINFMPVAAFSQHNPAAPRSHSHLRSYSSTTSSTKVTPAPPRPVSKSISTSALHTTAAVAHAPALPSRNRSPFSDDDGNMSTLPDPRSRSMTQLTDSGINSLPQHPDLDSEVATLSNKLINAINHQTNLDDTLSATRHELESALERVQKLEKENQELAAARAREVSLQRLNAESAKTKFLATIAEEKRQRAEVEKGKKEIEQELENLTTALFEEANKMVITAREEAQKDHDLVQRRNDQLTAQLADTESLLKSHQEQLAELKRVMEQMTEERDDQTNQTAPSTPGLSRFDSKDDETLDTEAPPSNYEATSPSYPTSFTHLLQPVLRTDILAYEDFSSLIRISKNIPASSRVSSGSYGSIGLGLGLGGYAPSQPGQANGSSSSLSTAGNLGSSPATPTTPASTVSNGSTNGQVSLISLKDTRFYKRVQAEDIEPTLRLDAAPGLSWLARRTVLNAVCEGSLVVEPMPTSTKPYSFSCSLCGESRKEPAHIRSHRFRTSENDSAQRYPLCKYCLGRVRSTCDFLGFLRILKDGHWRCDDEEAEKAAWEESVRLREQMFWCRVGGGVIPAPHHGHLDSAKSPRMSQERKDQERKISEELERMGGIQPKDITPVDVTFNSPRASKVPAIEETLAEDVIEAPSPSPLPSNVGEIFEMPEVSDESEKPESVRSSVQSTKSFKMESPGEVEREGAQRLSITIPGAFE
ncbi:hypothetical protein WAI453_007603 [Rhynchosporium graminicola]|uniref:Related to protein transport protein n=1 Tax=Rhynchosporium graminicola TaxID=2792576 RepID=A0A1E1L357_9HELO|nr:related to protein transport protein [Rhynchosporium commune]